MATEIYPHRTLTNTTFHLLGKIEEKVENNNNDGITLDCIACLVICAASVEAIVNYIGYKEVEKWDERSSMNRKIELIHESCNLPPDWSAEPLATLKILRGFRNSVMHSKPEIYEEARLDENGYPSLDPSYIGHASPQFCRKAYDQTKNFERTMFHCYEISAADSMSFGIHRIS